MSVNKVVNRLNAYIVVFASITFVLSNVIGVFVSPWIGFFHEYMASISLFFLYCTTLLLAPYYKLSTIFLLTVIVALIPLLQYIFGVMYFSGDAFVFSAYIFGAAIAIFCGYNLSYHGYRQQSFYVFSMTLVVLGLANSFLSLYQLFDLEYGGHFILEARSYRIYGNLAQPNNLATFLVMSLLAAWYLFEKRVLSSGTFFLLVCLFSLTLSLPQSRTTLVVFVLVLLLYFYFKSRVKLKASWLYFFLVAAIYWMSLFVQEHWFDAQVRDFAVGHMGSGGAPVRIAIWNDIITAIFQGPIWGYGWGQVSVAQIVGAGGASGQPLSYSHNFFLDLLVWNGPIIGAIIVFFLIYIAVKILLACKNVENFFGLAIIFAIGAHALLEFPLAYTFLLFPLFFVFGLLLNDVDKSKFSASFPCYVVVFCFFSFLVIVFRDYTIIVDETRQSALYSLDNLSGDRESQLEDVLVLSHLSEYIRFKDAAVSANMTPEKIEWMRKVSHRFPAYGTLMKYKRACSLNGHDEEAERVYQVVQKLFVRKAKS